MAQGFKAPLSTYFKAPKTALYFLLICPCFSVCRTRGSDHWSTGWIPTCLEQTQGIVCPWSDHHLLYGVLSNFDICKYFTHSSAFLTGSFLQMTSWRGVVSSEESFKNSDQILSLMSLCLRNLYLEQMWPESLTRKCVTKGSYCNSAALKCATPQKWHGHCSSWWISKQTTFHVLYVVYFWFPKAPSLNC